LVQIFQYTTGRTAEKAATAKDASEATLLWTQKEEGLKDFLKLSTLL
jgi:hypothetical protein